MEELGHLRRGMLQEPFLFVSYSRKDKDKLESELELMRKGGVPFWYDNKLQVGAEWDDVIAQQIEKSSALAVLMTANASQSTEVQNEIRYALSNRKPLIMIYHEQVRLPAGIEMRKGSTQHIERSTMDDEAFVKSIRKALAAAAASEGTRYPFPIISIMGTKGGTGKTTMVVAMAELIASTGHNVLVIDADLEAGGAQKHLAKNVRRKTRVASLLDMVYARQDNQLCEADLGMWDATPPYLANAGKGKVYLLPSKHETDTRLSWNALANIPGDERNQEALKAVNEAIARWRKVEDSVDAVVIDSGAEQNPLVSAAMVVADYHYIVSAPNAEFASLIDGYERMHKQNYPQYNASMTVLVNQAGAGTARNWRLVANAHFIREDPEFRSQVANSEPVDFEGIGLNNFYTDLLKAMVNTFHTRHQGLLPDPAEVWVKPYVRKMGNFPEKMLSRFRYRYALMTLILTLIGSVSLSCVLAILAFSSYMNPGHVATLASADQAGNLTYQEHTERMAQIDVPEPLRNMLAVTGSSVQLNRILQPDEITLFSTTVDYAPAVEAMKAAQAALLQKRDLKVYGLLAPILPLLAGASVVVVQSNLNLKRRRLLKKVVFLRDSPDEKRFTAFIVELLQQGGRDRELMWLRRTYQHWLNTRAY